MFPDSMSLPNLKGLHHQGIALVGLKATNEIISSFPSLKNLAILKGRLDLVENFVISTPRLVSLVMHNVYQGRRRENVFNI
jgi:hypothetical protein